LVTVESIFKKFDAGGTLHIGHARRLVGGDFGQEREDIGLDEAPDCIEVSIESLFEVFDQLSHKVLHILKLLVLQLLEGGRRRSQKVIDDHLGMGLNH
jgi:hypothetical protein